MQASIKNVMTLPLSKLNSRSEQSGGLNATASDYPLKTELKAVIFDYGKVLCLPQPQEIVEAMADLCQVPIEHFHEAYYRYRLSYDSNRLNNRGYWESVAGSVLSLETVSKLIDLDNFSWSYENRPMRLWAEELRRAGIKTAILSNMPADMLAVLPSLCPWIPEVDFAVYSCALGVAKPHPAIYRAVLDGLAIEPKEALFLDDKKVNTDAAIALGMNALVFDSNTAIAEKVAVFKLPPFRI